MDKYIVSFIVILIIYHFLFNKSKQEHMTDINIGNNSNLNDDALANISSLYNNRGLLTVPAF